MNKIDTHVCLVATDPLPNLTPLLDLKTRPQRVFLVGTREMHEQAQWLAGVVRSLDIEVKQWPIDDSGSFSQIKMQFQTCLAAEESSGIDHNIALNASGGSRFISLAAYETFHARGTPIFYVSQDNENLVWLQPDNIDSQKLSGRVGVMEFLRAHGAIVQGVAKNNPPKNADIQLAATMITNLDIYARPMAGLIRRANQSQLSQLCIDDMSGDRRLHEVIDLFVSRGQIRRKGNQICFPSEQDRRFVSGGWMTNYVFAQVSRLLDDNSCSQDIAYGMNMEYLREGKHIPHELDIVFFLKGQLYIIECNNHRSTEANENFVVAESQKKLDDLQGLMGSLQVRSMLVSYLDLPILARNRAKDMGVSVCAGSQLHDLRKYLLDFIHG